MEIINKQKIKDNPKKIQTFFYHFKKIYIYIYLYIKN